MRDEEETLKTNYVVLVFNKTNVESSSMRRTRAKATRDENEEDCEDVSSSFSFMVRAVIIITIITTTTTDE